MLSAISDSHREAEMKSKHPYPRQKGSHGNFSLA